MNVLTGVLPKIPLPSELILFFVSVRTYISQLKNRLDRGQCLQFEACEAAHSGAMGDAAGLKVQDVGECKGDSPIEMCIILPFLSKCLHEPKMAKFCPNSS